MKDITKTIYNLYMGLGEIHIRDIQEEHKGLSRLAIANMFMLNPHLIVKSKSHEGYDLVAALRVKIATPNCATISDMTKYARSPESYKASLMQNRAIFSSLWVGEKMVGVDISENAAHDTDEGDTP